MLWWLSLFVTAGLTAAQARTAVAQPLLAQVTRLAPPFGQDGAGGASHSRGEASPLDVAPMKSAVQQLHRSRRLIDWAQLRRHPPTGWVSSLALADGVATSHPEGALVRVNHGLVAPTLGVRLRGGLVLTTLDAVGGGFALTVEEIGGRPPGAETPCIGRRSAGGCSHGDSGGDAFPARVVATSLAWGLALVTDGFRQPHLGAPADLGLLLAGSSRGVAAPLLSAASPIVLGPTGGAALGARAELSSPTTLVASNADHPVGTPWVDGSGRLVGFSTRACLARAPEAQLDSWQLRFAPGDPRRGAGGFSGGNAWSKRVSHDENEARRGSSGWRSGTALGAARCRRRSVVLPASAIRQFVSGAVRASYGWIGASVQSTEEGTTRGVVVVELEAGSPLRGIGLRTRLSHGSAADVILAVAEHRVAGPAEFFRVVGRLVPGIATPLLVVRGARLHTLDATAGLTSRGRKTAWRRHPVLLAPPPAWLEPAKFDSGRPGSPVHPGQNIPTRRFPAQ